MLVCAAFAQPSLRDAITGASARDVVLDLPAAYVALSPLSRILDTLGLLSIGQDIALALTVLVLVAVISRSVKQIASALAAIAALYVLAAIVQRPMAALAARDSNIVRVDFHSHTKASGDARADFTAEKNRTWHALGGFDAAYISDHRSFAGVVAALPRNPARAGDGVSLLSAYEGRYHGTFQIFLSLTREDSATLIDPRKHLREGMLRSGRLPISVMTIPGPLSDVDTATRNNAPHERAIEISDGSPRALWQIDNERNEILERANKLGLALVSGSNNHGWGRVVVAWSLVPVPGWRSLSPDSLAAAIENVLVSSAQSVRVVERTRPTLHSPIALLATLPVAAAQTLITLTSSERLVWLFWIWLVWGVLRLGKRPTAEGRRLL